MSQEGFSKSEFIQFSLQNEINRHASRLAFTMLGETGSGNQRAAEQYQQSLRVKTDGSEELFGEVPAYVATSHSGQERTVFFNEPTFDYLCGELGEPYDVTQEDVIHLYIGTGMVRNLYVERLKRKMQHEAVTLPPGGSAAERIEVILKDASSIDTDLRALSKDNFSEDEVSQLLAATMHTDGEKIARINALRFYAGILFMYDYSEPILSDGAQAAYDMFESRIRDGFRSGIKAKLVQSKSYKDLLHFLQFSDYTAEQNNAERFSELEIAATIPMGFHDIRRIMQVVSTA